MSEKRMTPSIPKRRKGCIETSTARLDVRAEVEEREALAHLAVLGQVAPGLPHEPDGRDVHGAGEGGVDEALAGRPGPEVAGTDMAREVSIRFAAAARAFAARGQGAARAGSGRAP